MHAYWFLHYWIIDMTTKLIRAGLLGAVSLSFSAGLLAENGPLLDRERLAIGGGVALNSINGPVDDELGFQIFAAYELPTVNVMQYVNSSIELGYMDYGFDGEDTNGLWTTFVLDGAIKSQWGWLARLGLDLGDDSGFMFGAGVSYAWDTQLSVRAEYVIRDEVDSLQLNVIHHF